MVVPRFVNVHAISRGIEHSRQITDFAVVTSGLWNACVTYFVVFSVTYINPVYLYDNTPVGQWTFSTCIFHLVTLVVNLQVCVARSALRKLKQLRKVDPEYAYA